MNSVLRYGKTGLTWGVLVSTIAWSMGLAALLTPLATQAVASGDLIKASTAAVYYYGDDGKRYVFPNEKTYKTWYDNFSGVAVITDSELAAIPIGGNVTYKPGVKMVKITTDPKVYAVDAGGTLRPIKDEATASALYGTDWNTKIDDVSDAFFTNYTVGAAINAASDFDINAVKSNATSINDDKNISSGGSVGGGSLSVSLAADTPASGVVPASAARVPFTKINLTNNTSLDAVVDSLVIERMGLAQDAAFASIDILDGNMDPLNQFSKTFNSDHQASVGDDFTVPANSSKSIYIAANMASSLTNYAGELPVLALTSITLKGGGSVSGTLPIAGNHKVLNGTITIGTATVAAGANNPSASSQNVGTNGYTVTSFKVTAGSAEDLTIKSVTFTNNGSASPEDVKNLELVNLSTGTTVATKTTVDKDKVKMMINEPLEKGKNRTYDLRLDIGDGSGRTISYDIDQQADLVVMGDLYGYNILPTYPASGTPYFNQAVAGLNALTTIGDGTLRFESVSLDSSNVAEGLTQVTLGKFKAVAKGEPVNITSIGWNFTITTSTVGSGGNITDITNVSVYDENGSAVVSSIDPSRTGPNPATANGVVTDTGTATSTDTITVPTGETIYTIKGDLSSDFTANDTIRAGIIAGDVTARGDVSGNTITATPSTNTQSTTVSVKAASITSSLSSVPTDQTVVAGVTQFHVASLVLDASNSGSDVRINSIKVPFYTTGSAFPNQLQGVKLWDGAVGGTQVPVNGSPDSFACDTAGCAAPGDNATSTNTITSGDLTVTKGTTKVIPITVNVGTGATSGSFFIGEPTISGIDQDNNSVAVTYTIGHGGTMTLAAGGTLNATIGNEPTAALVIGGSSAIAVGEVTLEALYDSVTFPDGFGFTAQVPGEGIAGNQDEVNTISLWDGGTQLGSAVMTGANATITAPNFEIGIGETKKLTWKSTFNVIDTGSPASSGSGVKIALTNIDANSKVGSTVTQSSIESATFPAFHVFKSLPVVATTEFSNSSLVNGVNTLQKFSVTADNAGSTRGVGVYKFTFGINTTGVTMTTTGYTLYEGASDGDISTVIAQGTDFTVTEGAPVTGAGYITLEAFLDVGDNASTANEMRVIGKGSTKYYTLKGTVSGVNAAGDSISTALAGDSGFAATASRAAATVDKFTGVDNTDQLDDFIWSDLNLTNYNSSTATHSTMFFNGYRVPGLNNSTSTPSVTSRAS